MAFCVKACNISQLIDVLVKFDSLRVCWQSGKCLLNWDVGFSPHDIRYPIELVYKKGKLSWGYSSDYEVIEITQLSDLQDLMLLDNMIGGE